MRTKTAERKRAPGPSGLFGLRNTARMMRDELKVLRELADRYGDIVEMQILGKPYFMVNHPDDIETVMVKHARIMLRDEYSAVLQRALGLGLLTSEGELWKRQRKLIAQAFTPKRIRDYSVAMVDVAERGLRSLRDGQEINIHREMSRTTLEVVAAVLFGTGVSESETATVRDALAVMSDFYANSPEVLFKLPPWFPTPLNYRMNAAVRDVDAVIYGIIGKRRHAEPQNDLLGTLLAAQDDAGTSMTDKQLRDEAITLFLAGHETTALALAHTIYLLSKHPVVERRLHAEIAHVLNGRLPNADDMKRLPYTEQVLKESMRLYPPAWTTGRETSEEFELRGYTIPKGSQILLSEWVVHRDPRFFPNPEGFDPDRWEPEKAAKLPRYAYFPFGGGPRVCIGNHFAMMEATLILATLVQRFRFELLPGQRLELAPSVTLRPRGEGLRMRVVERAQSESAIERAAAGVESAA